MDLIADTGKVLKAYQIINQQLAHEMQKKKIELKMHEERYNATNELLLQERQENKALRDMVRKLKDQMQVITKVIVSVQEQTENVFERINRPHEQAERMMQNYTPRAQQIYERRRTENPPYVDEYAIAEENETNIVMETDANEETNAPEENNDTRINESGADEDASFAANRSSEIRCSIGAPVPINSPLVQRLKRPSRNVSLDESFETIDHDRVFKLSRRSQERRKIYATIDENVTDLQSVDNTRGMDIDEQLTATLRNLSPVKNMSCSSAKSMEQDEVRPSLYSPRLKKMASESMLSQIQRSPVDNEEVTELSNSEQDDNEMTSFDPAELVASCSTPVATKGLFIDERTIDPAKDRELPRRGRGRPRGRGRGRIAKTRSETELHTVGMNPVVVLRPLTKQNILAHEHKTQPNRKARTMRCMKECNSSDSDSGSMTMNDGCTWVPSSSVENLSTLSTESNRPRRKAAPKTLREPSLGSKLRRT
uniref:Shugoshin C-terminal domain-containing protein n=1 Tax=Anopheles funestus TaxID=62324 RepID=A0A182R8S4_ANOFN